MSMIVRVFTTSHNSLHGESLINVTIPPTFAILFLSERTIHGGGPSVLKNTRVFSISCSALSYCVGGWTAATICITFKVVKIIEGKSSGEWKAQRENAEWILTMEETIY
jgi:hypothetical protein